MRIRHRALGTGRRDLPVKHRQKLVSEMYALGKSGETIARELGYCSETLRKDMKVLGLRFTGLNNDDGRRIPNKVDDGHVLCRQCGLVKPYQVRHGAFCASCVEERKRLSVNRRPDAYFKRRVATLRFRVKKHHAPFDITWETLAERYKFQNGRCFYTDIVLETATKLKSQVDTALSVDKIVPEAGYVPGNVVLCTYKANRVKSDLTLNEIKAWIPGWYDRILAFALEDFPQVNIK